MEEKEISNESSVEKVKEYFDNLLIEGKEFIEKLKKQIVNKKISRNKKMLKARKKSKNARKQRKKNKKTK